MKKHLSRRTVRLLIFGLAFLAADALAQQAAGETSKTPPQAALQWRASAFPDPRSTHLRYRELPVRRILEVDRYNATRQMKPARVGVGRTQSREAMTTSAPQLRWLPLRSGGAVARLRITSPDAMAVRVGLRVSGLHPHVEMRFAGSDEPNRVVAAMGAQQAQLLADAGGLFWTPSTDGQTQIIELYRPSHVAAALARVAAPQLTHLLANSRNDFKIVQKIGESDSCNVDVACRVNELGADFVKAKNAVAHMQFVLIENGVPNTYICTGTLLNDTVEATQIPYFYSANHCIENQTVASTLNTFWRYEATACNSGVAAAVTQLSGGATYLYSNADTDALLLRLKDPAPAGAEFIGWDAAILPASSSVIGIHHPSGDAKKVSRGQQVQASSDAFLNGVGWLSGTTEGGSSGSGLFTLHTGGYRLRGGLLGGNASCSNTGSLGNEGNRDYYSRFDVAFPSIRAWLAPSAPIRLNGSQPLVPPRLRTTGANAAARLSAPGAVSSSPAQRRTRAPISGQREP